VLDRGELDELVLPWLGDLVDAPLLDEFCDGEGPGGVLSSTAKEA